MSNKIIAVSFFAGDFNCAQSILKTYGPDLGLKENDCSRIAAPFGAGMGIMQKTCGAVTGSFMVIGLKCDMTEGDDSESKDRAYSLTKEFTDRFIKKNKTINCRELLGCDITTDEGLQDAMDKNIFSTLCVKYIKDASEILEEILCIR